MSKKLVQDIDNDIKHYESLIKDLKTTKKKLSVLVQPEVGAVITWKQKFSSRVYDYVGLRTSPGWFRTGQESCMTWDKLLEDHLLKAVGSIRIVTGTKALS